nr:CPBP family intramembrane glutamic endopeptidase [uncultured Desulfuromonas sp.]
MMRSDRTSWLWLALWLVFPALATWTSFTLQWWPQVLYPLSKVVLVVAPFAVWRLHSVIAALRQAGVKATHGLWGLVSGAVLGAVIFAAWQALFQGQINGDGIVAKLTSLNLIDHYWSVALFIAMVNSLLEEWYWRGFVFERLKERRLAAIWVVLLGGAGFGFHHYFTLIVYFSLPITLFFTFATMVAGALWSWMRTHGASLIDCYISHLIADVALLWIGWQLLGGTHVI